jgi:hypothetical protein
MHRSDDLIPAIGLALAAVALESLIVLGDAGNLSLLLAGIAGAALTHWHLTDRVHDRLLVATGAIGALASVALVSTVLRTAHPSSGMLVTAVGALMATVLTGVAVAAPEHRSARER